MGKRTNVIFTARNAKKYHRVQSGDNHFFEPVVRILFSYLKASFVYELIIPHEKRCGMITSIPPVHSISFITVNQLEDSAPNPSHPLQKSS